MASQPPPQPPPMPASMHARPFPARRRRQDQASNSSYPMNPISDPLPSVFPSDKSYCDDVRDARRRTNDRKREWRRTRSPSQLKLMREKDAERKRLVRKQMSPEERRIEREKDARRKANKRRKEKEDRLRSSAMSISRFVS